MTTEANNNGLDLDGAAQNLEAIGGLEALAASVNYKESEGGSPAEEEI